MCRGYNVVMSNDHAAFLRAILDNPGDDLPRLVDLLRDNGVQLAA